MMTRAIIPVRDENKSRSSPAIIAFDVLLPGRVSLFTNCTINKIPTEEQQREPRIAVARNKKSTFGDLSPGKCSSEIFTTVAIPAN